MPPSVSGKTFGQRESFPGRPCEPYRADLPGQRLVVDMSAKGALRHINCIGLLRPAPEAGRVSFSTAAQVTPTACDWFSATCQWLIGL